MSKDPVEVPGQLSLPRSAIIIDNDLHRRKLIAQNLEVYTGCEIIFKKDADDVLAYLKKHPKIDLIVSINMVGDEYTMLKIYYYVKSQRLGIPMILLGQNAKLVGEVKMCDPEKWEEVIKSAGSLMSVTAEKMMEIEVPPYYPVNIASMQEMKDTNTELFIFKDGQYTTWKTRGAKFEDGEVKQLLLSGLVKAFVNKMDRLEFMNHSSVAINTTLKNLNATKDARANAVASAMTNVSMLLKEVGMNQAMVVTSRNAVKGIMHITQNTPGIDEMMNMITQSKDSYLYRHCLLISMLGHNAITHVEWGNKEQKSKIAFAAFFHDITIPEDNLCKIHSKKDLIDAKLSPEDYKKVERHAYQCCEVLAKYPNLPFGADNLILQHHGSLTGIGFADDQLDNRVSPLAVIFRVLEDYVDHILRLPGKEQAAERKGVLGKLEEKYNKASYRKAFLALKKTITDT
jgi:HD-GYP domain-containing protein (c-di-GMP phosphodiesterase class II)